MDITGTGQSASAALGGTAFGKLSENFDNFLMLLTQQLKNQDPLSPMDTAQFTQQLVQFAGVEQQINSNKKLDQLISLQTGNQAAAAISYLGKSVTAESQAFVLADGTGEFTYTLPRPASASVVIVTDAAGRPVRILQGEVSAGEHAYSWDGTDANGNSLPDGLYRIEVSAVDAKGAQILATTHTTGLVSGVAIENGEIILNIGPLAVPFGKVRSVNDA